jgi:5,5'-dehydrodivanillate O-demethylase
MAVSVEENRLLTQVGKGTPMGELLRRYWWPIIGSGALREKPVHDQILDIYRRYDEARLGVRP